MPPFLPSACERLWRIESGALVDWPPSFSTARHFVARPRLFAEPFYRLAHGEADFLPGLVIDRSLLASCGLLYCFHVGNLVPPAQQGYGDELCIQPSAGLDPLLWPISDALDEASFAGAADRICRSTR